VLHVVHTRSLIASHLFQGKILAWQCTLCGKLFCRTVDELKRDRGDTRPEYVEGEFQIHSCVHTLIEDLEGKRQGLQAIPEVFPFKRR
jgi:hypothetical protein